jgi:hypothetical protein
MPAAIVLASLLTWGCGGPPGPDYGRLDLAEVEGGVTLDGEPLAGALIVFEAADHSFSYGKTDRDGHYRLMFNSEKSGVTRGPKTVRIWSSLDVPGEAEMRSDEDDTVQRSQRPERVPARYNARSTLTATVEEDSQTFDFDLQS